VSQDDVTSVVERIGRRIAGARVERGLSQSKLAELAKTSASRIGALERADDHVRLDTLIRVAKAVGFRVTLEPEQSTAA
jgi:transcriptional regulator with XRE-family HTH domain